MKVEQLQSSSALTFARSLFFAAEGKELYDQGFVFASAVSTYYSLFHLGGALILAYCSHPAPTEDPHASTRRALEKEWRKGRRIALPRPVQIGSASFSHAVPDPAEDIGHGDVPTFLQRELPEVSESLGCGSPTRPGTLRDMREFVSYAPRMVSNGRINVLYSGCQYEPQDFRHHLKQHLDRIDEFFHGSAQWMNRKRYNELYSRILSGDFILFEFRELRSYHPESVVKRAWAIYRSICEHVGADWRIYHCDAQTWYDNERGQRERYAEAIRHFES